MNDSLPTSKHSYVKPSKSLSRGLVLWFLLLSLLPLALISWISYEQSYQSLNKSASNQLNQSSNAAVKFIKNWFKYRVFDINSQAQSKVNSQLLESLIEGFKGSGKQLDKYVKSYDWHERIDIHQSNLATLSRRYDYIYDIFLIDVDGNILFSVAKESDFGTNLFTGPYAETRFSTAVKNTLNNGKIHFSDLERYEPSNNIVAGFLTAPLLDDLGNKLGVLSFQIKFNIINELFQEKSSGETTLTHYLVGEDAKIRTSIFGDEGEILKRVIDTEQFIKWKEEHAAAHEHGYEYSDDMKEEAFTYLGPDNKLVIGSHQMLRLPSVRWVLISEVNHDEALSSAIWLREIALLTFIFTGLVVIMLAIFLAQRITRPIRQLVDTSMKVAAGEMEQQVNIKSDNEIGQLINSFNFMIANRKKHEEELEQTTLQAQKAFAELAEQKFALDQHAIVAITDVKGTITFANEKFTEISGYENEELIGQNHRLLNSGYHDKDFFRDMYHTIANGNVWHGEVCNKAKGGRLYWLDTTIVPFLGDDNKPKNYIALRTDVTKRKNTEAELTQAKETAEAATLQKSEFLANMSHEIRTPMNGVIGMTGLLLDTKLTSRQRSYAVNTMSSADALLSIINDILDFSKIEAGKMELELLPFNLQTLMEDVSELMAMKCREKGIEMLLRIKPGTEQFVLGDPGRIRQVLLNLLSNAIKFTEEGSVLLTVESGEVVDGQTTISVSVADSGIGISEDKIDKIFNKFDQEDGSTTRKYGGTGLGLAICRQLCELMGGKIKVETKKDKGSVFSFTMRLETTQNEVVSSIQPGDLKQLEGLKTLIVDDLLIARTIISEQLAPLNMDISMVSSAAEAIEILAKSNGEKKPFDIVITDFHMPEMDGEMLADEIKDKELLKNGLLLFITSSPRKGDGKRLKDKGFDGYLTKPTRSLDVPLILSLIWDAKLKNKDIPLVTRHMIQEVKMGKRKQIKLSNTHVLLAEDNPVNQMVATEYLERYGCSVTPAGNGLEAIAQYKNTSCDLIFMDCQMPEMDGYEATGVIREWEKINQLDGVPIVAFTANAMQGDKDKCFAAGMDDYISKPVSETALEDVLKKWFPDRVELVDIDEESGNEEAANSEQFEMDEDIQLDLPTFNTLKGLFGDTFKTTVDSFTTNAAENIKRIENALDSNSDKDLERAAHSLKGASGQFGAQSLSQLAEKMEYFGKEGKFNDAKEIFSELEKTQKKVAELMQNEIAAN